MRAQVANQERKYRETQQLWRRTGMSQDECKECEGLGAYADPSGPGSLDCAYCDGTGKAASASQSSMAGAAKGGITNEEFRKTLLDLLFGHKHGGLDNTEAILAHVARQESGAVAEGVDTALPKPRMLGGDPAFDDAVYGYTADDMQEHGAQQREAGRRDMHETNIALVNENCALKEKVARLTVDLGAAKIRINKYERAVGASVEALARQPVSEGLTESQLDNLLLESGLIGVLGDHPDYEAQLIQFANAYAALAAVPPAKAEGMSDCRIDMDGLSCEKPGCVVVNCQAPRATRPNEGLTDLQLAYGYLWHVNASYEAPPGEVLFSVTPEQAAYRARQVLRGLLTNEQRGAGINGVRAILAQQANGETK